MNDNFLKQLNFQTLLQYPENLIIKNSYSNPILCNGFCIDCEKKEVIDLKSTKLTFLSHSCTTEDYVSILGEMPNNKHYEGKVMFILEQPGGDYNLGNWLFFHGVKKYPPVKHYYWTPDSENWIMSINELIEDGNFYGNYFSYLINKFGFTNCYITNAIKCKIVGANRYTNDYNTVSQNCRENFLQKEFTHLNPSLICCFGDAAFNLTNRLIGIEGVIICRLYHPHAIKTSQRYGYTRKEMFIANDREIGKKIK